MSGPMEEVVGTRWHTQDVIGDRVMKDCNGTPLIKGDVVEIVCPLPPLKGWSLRMLGDVVGENGRRVSIRLQSYYAKGLKHALSDSLRKWEPKSILTEGPSICQACRNPGAGLVCLCR